MSKRSQEKHLLCQLGKIIFQLRGAPGRKDVSSQDLCHARTRETRILNKPFVDPAVCERKNCHETWHEPLNKPTKPNHWRIYSALALRSEEFCRWWHWNKKNLKKFLTACQIKKYPPRAPNDPPGSVLGPGGWGPAPGPLKVRTGLPPVGSCVVVDAGALLADHGGSVASQAHPQAPHFALWVGGEVREVYRRNKSKNPKDILNIFCYFYKFYLTSTRRKKAANTTIHKILRRFLATISGTFLCGTVCAAFAPPFVSWFCGT